MKKIVATLLLAWLASACTSPAVSKAVGTGTEGDTPIVVRMSPSAVLVENHAGRPLLSVHISIAAADVAKPFVVIVPTIDPGATSEQPLTGFRDEDLTTLDPTAVHPLKVMLTARDTLAKTYEVTVPWKP